MSDSLEELPTIAGGTVYRCPMCGREGNRPDAVDHHDDCPDGDGDG